MGISVTMVKGASTELLGKKGNEAPDRVRPSGHDDIRRVQRTGDEDMLDLDEACKSQDSQPQLEAAPLSVIISKSLTIHLYTSHFVSMWNSRLFEAACC